MVYGLKLLLPILALWLLTLIPLKWAFRRELNDAAFRSMAKMMLLCIVVTFLSVRVEFFMVTSVVAMLISQHWLGGTDRAKIATYWATVIIFPPLQLALTGFAGINYIIGFDHSRLAAIVLLAPIAFKRMVAKPTGRQSTLVMDLAVFSYPLLCIALLASNVSLSATVRSVLGLVLDVALPYFVMTRTLTSWDDIKFVLVRLTLVCVFAGAVALLEAAVRQNIYSDLQWVYGVKWSLTHTLMRGGMNRVEAMTPQPIVLAVQLMFTIGLWMGLRLGANSPARNRLVLLGLFAALLFTWSRGPWLGALAFLISLVALAKIKPRAFGVLLVICVIAAVGVKGAGLDVQVMTLLKDLFGSSQEDAGSIEYRSRLLDTSLALIRQSPWFGVPNYAAYMQDLVQGEGIIDLVNAYIGVTLNAGLLGLVLFVSPLLLTLGRLLASLSKMPPDSTDDRKWLLRVFVALIVGFMVAIFTTSILDRLALLLLLLVAAPATVLATFSPQRNGRLGYATGIGNAPVGPLNQQVSGEVDLPLNL